MCITAAPPRVGQIGVNDTLILLKLVARILSFQINLWEFFCMILRIRTDQNTCLKDLNKKVIELFFGKTILTNFVGDTKKKELPEIISFCLIIYLYQNINRYLILSLLLPCADK